MSERIGVVGSREGVEKANVEQFLDALLSEEPGSVVVSGGAKGVDTWAETGWLQRGGSVVSYRPRAMHKPNEIESWAITKLTMGWMPSVEILSVPTFADITSALFYRNCLIVDDVERLVAFHAFASAGTAHAKAYATDRGVPVYDML